jgi:hypothetical protein
MEVSMLSYQRTHKWTLGYVALQVTVLALIILVGINIFDGSPFYTYAGVLPGLVGGLVYLATGRTFLPLALLSAAGGIYHMYIRGYSIPAILVIVGSITVVMLWNEKPRHRRKY